MNSIVDIKYIIDIINYKYRDVIQLIYIRNISYYKDSIEVLYFKKHTGKKTCYSITNNDLRKYKLTNYYI